MSRQPGTGSPGEEPGAGTPRTRRRLPLRIAEVREVQAPPAPTPLPGHLCERASMPPRSWWSRPPEVETWGSAPPVSRPRRWRRSRCSRRRRASRPSGIRSATRTGWRRIGRPRGPCRPGGIAASRPRPPGSARVGAIGCAGARTRRRDPRCGRASGTSRGPLWRVGWRARMGAHARVSWACRLRLGPWCPARPDANAARTRLSAVGSSCRMSLPIYCICRVRAPCERIRCAATTASCRASGRSSRASWAADRATSWTPSACNACASRLR